MISEIKIENSFPAANLLIHGFSQPYMIDWNSSGGRISFYVREEIPSNLTKIDFLLMEGLYIELKLRKQKWFINCSYNHHRNVISNHLGVMNEPLDFHSSLYNSIINLGEFIVGVSRSCQNTCDIKTGLSEFHLMTMNICREYIYIYIYILATIRYHFSGENLPNKFWLDQDAITSWEIGMKKKESFM